MDRLEKQKILDSLTRDQRIGIAKIIRSADIEGGYNGMDEDGGSFWCEDVSETLEGLASEFEKHDSDSVLD
jgi:hypothetical protein